MGVKFTNTFVSEMRPVLTMEDTWRELSAYGGIHSFDFDSQIECRDFNASEWEIGSGSWSFEDGLVGNPDGTDSYSFVWWKGDGSTEAQNTPPSFVVDVDIPYGLTNTVIAFRGNASNNFYFVHLSGGSAAFYKVKDGVTTKLEDCDYVEGAVFMGPGRVRLAVRQYQFSENDVDRWLFMSVWMDDRLVLSSRDHLPNAIPGLRFGLGVYNRYAYDPSKYTYVRIPDMTEIIPWASIDPGEAPLQGIQRAVADRVIKSFVRADGTLRVWRPKPATVCQIFTADGESQFATEIDLRELYNHVRLYYSLSWVETFDEGLYEAYGHRFTEVNNTYIEDEDEAYREALAIIRRYKEGAFRCDFATVRGGLLLEPEDRVTMPNGEDYIIDAISLRYDKHALLVSIKGRKYAYS